VSYGIEREMRQWAETVWFVNNHGLIKNSSESSLVRCRQFVFVHTHTRTSWSLAFFSESVPNLNVERSLVVGQILKS
jgi:hypothetical protein